MLNRSIINDLKRRKPETEYKRLCAQTHRQTNGICACCMKNKSQEIHHTSYSLYGKSDKPGVNVFPVCKQCHDNECHSADNWIKDPTHPTLKNRNSRSFTKKLQQNMKALTVEAEDPTQMTVTSAEGGLVIEIKYINSNVTHKILINPDRYVCIRTLYRCGGLKDKARPSDFKNSDACKKKIENIRRKEKIDADFFPGNVPTIKPLWVHPDLAKEYVSYLGNHTEVSLLTRSLDKVLNHNDIEANIHPLPRRKETALVKDESVIESIVTHNNMEDIVIGDDVEVVLVSDYKVKTTGQIVFENVFKHGDWVCLNGTLYQFNGDYYVLRSDEYVLNLIQKFTNCYQVIRDGLKTTPLATTRDAKEGLNLAKVKLYTDPGEINPPGYLNLSNCVLHISWDGSMPKWKALPKSGDIKFTYPGTVKYDPGADPKMCDRLLSALDPEPKEILLRVLAGALDLPKVRALRGRAVRTLFLWGAGSNGKDAIRETVAQVLGGYGMGAISLSGFAQYDAGRKFPLANLPNYRINWSSESGEVDIEGLQSLKAAQTGDVLQCERKGKDEFEFTPNTVFLFNTNQPPKMVGSFNSSSSRYAVIQFSKTFKDNPSAPGEIQADPRFKNDPKFIGEQVAPAFLNYLLSALTRLAADGIDYSPLDQTLREVRGRASHLLEFFDDIGLGLCEGSKVTVSELWDKLREHYIDVGTLKIDDAGREIYAEVNGCDRPIKSKAVLAAKVLEAFPTVTKVTERNRTVRTTYFVGLGFSCHTQIDNINPALATVYPMWNLGLRKEQGFV